MKALNKSAEAVFAKLTAGLGVGSSRKIDNAPGVFLPVHVERLSDSTYSIAHYVEQGGDLMADPDVVFYVAGGQTYPIEITQALVGVYRRYVEFEGGKPARINARGQADLTSFANMMMRNIRAQQMTGRQNMREQHELTGPGSDGLYRYRGASIELSSAGTRHWWATVRFRSQEIDFEARSSDEALGKAKGWIDSAPEFQGRHTPAPDDYGRPYPREAPRRGRAVAQTDFDFDSERDQRWIDFYDGEALDLMQGWWGGQADPLYAIASSGGNYAWVFEDAISNLDADIARVKKIGRNKYQFGRGTFSGKEIEELHIIRDALAEALSGAR